VLLLQPMTILMTRVCMSPAFTKGLAAAVVAAGGSSSHAAAVPLASAFAVVIASNTAANFSVMGALAGIMFVNILQQRGMSDLGYLRFSKLMVPAGITSTLVALVVLGAEFVTWKV
jgi:Na+/H+ antiporter NhaD/arsenite permease-like protein